ncbi:hypothetical protein JBO39_24000 [Serratia marcescens]|uniref:hypothetical protein n=1 Tax=Serratia marcescens TaxID=615 RepID=UPI0015D93BDE|nr:hypothetical protein [Serratia marcescens]MBL5824267.1 hypothetical protein [Serratia marcescens]QLJ63723.1 hypothetical protein HP437_00290 [Serratia marcescens]HEB0103569.1 hypothetical protein [Serratia marcescens]
MTRRIKKAEDLDEYQRTVLAGLYARRELDQGYRLSARQKQLILDDYLTELSEPPNTRRPRTLHSTLPPMADYHWHPPTPARRLRGR